ncbi:glycosyltransferase family 2 protein [Bacteriovorax sp. Seq25_V]|uniref:glycosyltransferase family 2 protein n=1 Tax=Bacteriovorax sp. Seq25_V TaxID=1201288 RepID=UPI000389DEC4|nr:glycosyltransferase family 2 protein [Bacteriovorax sp. Seq25_V]EQC43580.1 glycosyltransferase-like protein, family 2 [Bacteriovorax sp. Seq25_V]
MPQPLVSLIIPVHNGSKHILNLANNINSFTYKNIEVLIGDDASTDDTVEKIQEYQNLFPNLCIVQSVTNIGPGAMRNLLISKANGLYIAIQDCDDLSNSRRIEVLVNFLETNAAYDFVGSNCSLNWNGRRWDSITCPTLPTLRNWLLQNSVVHASIIFRKDVFLKCKYSESLRIGEDYYFLTSAYLKDFKFYNIHEDLYTYNISKTDIKSRSSKYFLDILKAKAAISSLFTGPLSFAFLVINILKLIIGSMRSLFYILSHQNNS